VADNKIKKLLYFYITTYHSQKGYGRKYQLFGKSDSSPGMINLQAFFDEIQSRDTTTLAHELQLVEILLSLNTDEQNTLTGRIFAAILGTIIIRNLSLQFNVDSELKYSLLDYFNNDALYKDEIENALKRNWQNTYIVSVEQFKIFPKIFPTAVKIAALQHTIIEEVKSDYATSLKLVCDKKIAMLNKDHIYPLKASEIVGMLAKKILSMVSFQKKHAASMVINSPNLIINVSNTETVDALNLIRAGVDVNRYTPYYANNALLLAVTKGWNHVRIDGSGKSDRNFPGTQKEIIESLLESAHLDINAILFNGMNIMHIVCMRGDDPAFVERLIKLKADIYAMSIEGIKPADLLNTDYCFAQEIISNLTGGVFGLVNGKTTSPNVSLTATLPSEGQRTKNIKKIKELFKKYEHSLYSSSILNNKK
jgi:ankyrin repeat protein